MNLPLAWQLGTRYAFSRGSNLSLVGWIAIGGLALSIAILVIVLSVVNGFERELQTRLFGVLPHLSIYGRSPMPSIEGERNQLSNLEGVNGAAEFVQGTALVAVPQSVRGVLLTGINPATYGNVSSLGEYVVADSMPGATPQSDESLFLLQPGQFGVLLGAGIARELNVQVGSKVTLVLPQASVSLVGVLPRQKRVEVVGILQSQSELDSRSAYLHIRDAQRLFRLGLNIHGYQLKLNDLFDAPAIGSAARATLSNRSVAVQSWMRTHGNLHQAIVIQKQTMFLLLVFLVGVAAFNLVSSLLMVVHQRSSDVAILRTMGASTSTFVVTFAWLAVALGGLGLGVGLALGVVIARLLPSLFAWVSETFSLQLMNEYFVNYLPVEVRASDLIGIASVAALLILVSALYPAWRVARTRPAEVLAHE